MQDYPYDPAKAKALLAQAGYPNGVDVELWYLPVTRPYNPDGKRMAELIQADWEKVGVAPSSSPTSGASTGSAARPASSTR